MFSWVPIEYIAKECFVIVCIFISFYEERKTKLSVVKRNMHII